MLPFPFITSLIKTQVLDPRYGELVARSLRARDQVTVFGGLSLGVSCDCFTKGVRKREDTQAGIALLQALAWRFICFGESYVNLRVAQACRIGGSG